MEKKIRKTLISMIIFMIMFSNFGFTIQAIASSEEFKEISYGFFKKDEVKFTSYFENTEGKETDNITSDVNKKVKLKFKITPQVEGYLKNARIKAVPTDGSTVSFRFASINMEVEEKEEILEVEENKNLELVGDVNEISNNITEETLDTAENVENEVFDVMPTVANKIENTAVTNEVSENTIQNTTNEVENNIVTSENENLIEEEIIDEEEYIKQEMEEIEEVLVSDIRIISDNEIELVNILEETEIEVELEYNHKSEIDINSLVQEISFRLQGKYIDVNLDEKEVAKEQILNIAWEYSQDIGITSEYTKFSPFKIGETTGIIAENKIVVSRNTVEEKYLPIKNMNIEIKVPTFNEKMPISVDVQANKLMVSKGQDSGFVEFSKDNWTYNQEEGTITINVRNENDGKAINSLGEDEYVIIYRFDEYTEDEKVTLKNEVELNVEEYSGNKINNILRRISETNEIITNKGELITYSIGTSEDKINKAKIYANYNSDEIPYETEYTSNIRLNVLTSDMLEELKIDSSKEFFIDKNGMEFQASGIRYKKIKFNYSDIKSTLENGGVIEIYSLDGTLLYTLTKDLVASEEDCTINMNNESGVIINVKDVSANGKIDIEITKAIARPDMDKSIFATFKMIESRITAEVKYANIEERLTLPTIGTKKEFKESYTRATLSINKEQLTTMQENENVELKIELNNNNFESDLYINPTFEIVYPKYIKEVVLESVNLLYENGLTVKYFETYMDGDNLKTRIELEGTQTRFVDNQITNGTNIILNTKMKLDEYTPRKEDQIKLYYYNEGVSNYQTQTLWRVNKSVPANILKQTNGFDVAVVEYQAPVGLLAINGIRNYDGLGAEVNSVKQGEMTRRININGSAITATMDLVVLNNTGNKCTDIVMLGRLPFKGNKDVITGEDLGTNINVTLKNLIQTDPSNSAGATIYYSANEKANKNLEDETNGWTTNVEDLTHIKSYLIVVEGLVENGASLKYSYDFEIPENLPYETKIVGSFGAYYNNITEVAVVYESSSADRIVLETEAGPKVEAIMNVDIGDGASIGEERYLKYTITVSNTGGIDATGITIKNKRPLYTMICKENDENNTEYIMTNDAEVVFNVDILKVGETIEKVIYVRTNTKPKIEEMSDEEKLESGYAKEDENGNIEYLEIPTEFYIENYATVTIENLAKEITTNTVKNKLIDSNFSINVKMFSKEEFMINSGSTLIYSVEVQNISENELNNVIVETQLPKEITFIGLEETNGDLKQEYDKETNILKIDLGTMGKSETQLLYLNCEVSNMKNIKSVETLTQFIVKADENIEEKSSIIKKRIVGPELVAYQSTSMSDNDIKECEEFEIIVNVNNTGEYQSKKIKFEVELPDVLSVKKVTSEGNKQITIQEDENKIIGELLSLEENNKASLIIKVKSNPLQDTEKSRNIEIETKVSEEYIGNLAINTLKFDIIDNPDRDKTAEEKKEENEKNTIKNPVADDSYLDETSTNNKYNTSNNTQNKKDDSNVNNNEIIQKHRIIGEVWFDKNQNGRKDDDEEMLSGVKVQLNKDGTMIKACTTDSTGTYRFDDLTAGKYTLTYIYDSNKYLATVYKKSGVEEDRNSDAAENTDGVAMSNTITITDADITNIDFGLKSKDKFDLKVNKYITKAIVTTKNKEKVEEFEDKEIAKLEIKSKNLKNTSIKLEYKIVVENIGNVSGTAEKIIDYMPKDMIFNEKENKGWYKGTDGNLYNETLKNTQIKAGEKKELTVILEKQMTTDNTGTFSNKVELTSLVTENGLDENKDGNTATQELIVTVSTGKAPQILSTIAVLLIIIAITLDKTGKVDLSKIRLNVTYKNKSKEKSKLKKVYK